MRKVVPLLVAAVSSLLSLTYLNAQQVGSGAGTDFYLTVLPSTRFIGDSMYVAVYSSYLANGTVSYTTMNGTRVRRPFRVLDPRRISYIGIVRSDVELRGGVIDSKYLPGDQTEEVHSTQVIRVETDSAVYAACLAGDISGSAVTSLLPTSVLGRSYVIATSAASVVKTASNDIDWSKSAPSQFAIVATTNNTDISIALRGRSSRETTGEKTIRLNAGEWYFIQSVLDSNASLSDLSGTRITATAPIAVFSGHQNAALPATSSMISTDVQRSYMMQQLVPVERWGTEYVVVPLNAQDPTLNSGAEFVRIHAAVDGTNVKMDGQSIATLNAAEYVDVQITDARVIVATEPVSIMQYNSSGTQQSPVAGNANMLCVPSRQQWRNEHIISAVQSKFNFTKVFGSQYIVVITPADTANSLLFDGEPTSSSLRPIGSSGYSYLVRKVSDGVHSVSCNSKCEVLMYGIGPNHRYGYCPDAEYPVHAYMRAALRIPDLNAQIGQTVSLKVILDSLQAPPTILGMTPHHYSYDLSFNATMMTPVDELQRGVIENGVQRIHRTADLASIAGSTTILDIPMICGLGDAESCLITLSNITWYTVNNEAIALSYDPVQGWLHLHDVWHDPNGPRLVNPQPGDLSVEISPNPLHGRAFVNCSSTVQSTVAPTLVLYNSMGEVLRDFSAELSGFSMSSRVMFDSEDIQPGVYYMRFSIGDKSAVAIVVIV